MGRGGCKCKCMCICVCVYVYVVRGTNQTDKQNEAWNYSDLFVGFRFHL